MKPLLEYLKISNIKKASKKHSNIPDGYVDLGLPSGTLWAENNVGAKEPGGVGWWYNGINANSGHIPAKEGVIPTEEQFNELVQNCSKLIAVNSRVIQLIGPNGNRISFPCFSTGDFWVEGRMGPKLAIYNKNLIFRTEVYSENYDSHLRLVINP